MLEKLKQVESDLATNRRWNRSSQALNWLNTHFNRSKKGLGFVTKRTIYLLIENMWDYLKILFVFIVVKRGIIGMRVL